MAPEASNSEIGTLRVFVGFLIAPTAAIIVFMLGGESEIPLPQDWPEYFVGYGFFVYAATALFGGPAYLLFKARGWSSLTSYAVAGAAIGLLVFVVLEVFVYYWRADIGLSGTCMLAGTLATTVFWLISEWSPRL